MRHTRAHQKIRCSLGLTILLLCSHGVAAYAQAEALGAAREAELAERRVTNLRLDQEAFTTSARERFFRYEEISDEDGGGPRHAEMLLTTRPGSLEVRKSSQRFVWWNLPEEEHYQRTVPYYLLATALRDQLANRAREGNLYQNKRIKRYANEILGALLSDVRAQTRDKLREIFEDVSTDQPGYWYFAKGLRRDSFLSAADEDGVSYLLHALSVGATDDIEAAERWQGALSDFYATNQPPVIERLQGRAVWSSLGLEKRGLWNDVCFRNGRRLSSCEAAQKLVDVENARRRRANEQARTSNTDRITTFADDARRNLAPLIDQLVDDLQQRELDDRKLVEGSLIALSDYHLSCWRGPFLSEVADKRSDDHVFNYHAVDPDDLVPDLYLFRRIHEELATRGVVEPYFFRNPDGTLNRPVAVTFIRCR